MSAGMKAYAQKLTSYLPNILTEHLLSAPNAPPGLEKQNLKTVAMFADIKGFTQLSVQCRREGGARCAAAAAPP